MTNSQLTVNSRGLCQLQQKVLILERVPYQLSKMEMYPESWTSVISSNISISSNSWRIIKLSNTIISSSSIRHRHKKIKDLMKICKVWDLIDLKIALSSLRSITKITREIIKMV